MTVTVIATALPIKKRGRLNNDAGGKGVSGGQKHQRLQLT
jgi:hypothetical protein